MTKEEYEFGWQDPIRMSLQDLIYDWNNAQIKNGNLFNLWVGDELPATTQLEGNKE